MAVHPNLAGEPSHGGALYRVAAFTDTPQGGNPAGVWIGDSLPHPDVMQRIAAEVGYSETAFVAPASGAARSVRYFSPEAEVSFCGHATIGAGAVLGAGDRETTYLLATGVGDVPVTVRREGRRTLVSLRSVGTRHVRPDDAVLEELLACLGWRSDEIEAAIPPAIAYAGAWHAVLAAAQRRRLATLEYDFDRLKSLMQRNNITTLQLVWREREDRFHSRNPFPVGGVVEDPATGAAAAALGGYLRDAGIIRAPARFEIRQGEAMGRPSLLFVDVPVSGGIVVSGTAAPL